MTHHLRTFFAAALAATALLLTACTSNPAIPAVTTAGHSDTAATSSTSPGVAVPTSAARVAATSISAHAASGTACALVTEKDVTAVLGVDPGKGSPFSSHGSTQCQYGSYGTQFVLVNLTPTHGVAGYDLIHKNRKLGAGMSVTDITGVGDRAFEVDARNTSGIYFNQGDAVMVVTVTIQTATTPPKAQTLTLAKTAAGRL
jgi:hypothetical protein